MLDFVHRDVGSTLCDIIDHAIHPLRGLLFREREAVSSEEAAIAQDITTISPVLQRECSLAKLNRNPTIQVGSSFLIRAFIDLFLVG